MKYKVMVELTQVVELDIEADSQEEAKNSAESKDMSDYEIPNSFDLHVLEIEDENGESTIY